MKHIEQILPEYAASEIDRMLVGDDDATATAALTVLLHSVTGCDIPQTSDLPESEVEELVPLCVSILRRHWQTPLTCLGDGTTPMSLSDLMRQAIGDRVQGNEALGIPPANANIAIAINALLNRKISNASQNDGIEDGISYVRLLCDSTIQPTELIDDNVGWVCNTDFNTTVERLSLNCVEVTSPLNFLNNNSTLKSLNMPHLKRVKVGNGKDNGFVRNCTELTDIEMPEVEYIYIEPWWQNEVCMSAKGKEVMEFPKLKEAYSPRNLSFCNFSACRVFRLPELEKISYQNSSFLMNWENLEELYMPKYSSNQKNGAGWHSLVSDMPKLRKLIMNKPLDGLKQLNANDSILFSNCPQAIHLEMGDNIDVNIVLNLWIPTMALRTDTTAEDYVDLREDMSFANNLEQFLYNFQTYLVDRLADRTGQSALTLTLSAEVYAALEAQEGQTILATLTNKNWTVASA